MSLESGSILDADTLSIDGGTVSSGIDLSYGDETEFELLGGGNLNVLSGATVSLDMSMAMARPKSQILAVPSAVSITLPGLRSLWMIPWL